MSLLDTEVRGILEQLRDNTEEAVSLPEPERLERGRNLSSQALETVSYTHLDVYKRQADTADFHPSSPAAG